MYIPKAFEVTDREKLVEFITQNSFAILTSVNKGQITATHLPLLYDQDSECLFGHMAKGNTQWQDLDGEEVLAIFHGPHAYISSRWYQEPNTVPTWNYVAVHVYGQFKRVKDSQRTAEIVKQTTAFYDPEIDLRATVDERSMDGLLNGIVAFELKASRWEGKWKLSQNHSLARRQNVINELEKSTDQQALEIARLMTAEMND